MPGPLARCPIRHPTAHRQLIHNASLFVLENQLQAAGLDPMVLARSPEDWGEIGPELNIWLEQTAILAFAAVATMSVIDFEAIIIDGAMPADVRAELVGKPVWPSGHDLRGLPKFSIEEGSIGSDARAMGAASLSLFANYIIDRDVLFKEAFECSKVLTPCWDPTSWQYCAPWGMAMKSPSSTATIPPTRMPRDWCAWMAMTRRVLPTPFFR